MNPIPELPVRSTLETAQQQLTLEQIKDALDVEAVADERGWKARIRSGRLLSQARDRVGRNFNAWVERNYRHSLRTAYRNIARYERWLRISNGRSLESMSLDDLDNDDSKCATLSHFESASNQDAETTSGFSTESTPLPEPTVEGFMARWYSREKAEEMVTLIEEFKAHYESGLESTRKEMLLLRDLGHLLSDAQAGMKDAEFTQYLAEVEIPPEEAEALIPWADRKSKDWQPSRAVVVQFSDAQIDAALALFETERYKSTPEEEKWDLMIAESIPATLKILNDLEQAG